MDACGYGFNQNFFNQSGEGGANVHLGIVLVVAPGKGDDARPDEAAHVVHVAIDHFGVTLHAAPQPDDLLQAQELLEHLRPRLQPFRYPLLAHRRVFEHALAHLFQ